MRLRGFLVAMPLAIACHAPAARGDRDAGAPTLSAADGAAGRPQVQLTWRLFEIQHELDRNGDDIQSAIFELLVNGGTPPRIALGRRSSAGCVVHDTADGTGAVSTLECRAAGHDEVARVARSAPGELRVEAYGHDADAGIRTNPRSATVTVPADAEVVVDPGLARIPDETPTK